MHGTPPTHSTSLVLAYHSLFPGASQSMICACHTEVRAAISLPKPAMQRRVRFWPKCISVQVASIKNILSYWKQCTLLAIPSEQHHAALQTHIKAMLALVAREVLVIIGANSFHLIFAHID